MSDYTQITLFTPKDALVSGNPNKRIRGSEFDPEFEAISVAIATKYDSSDIASNAEAAALSVDTKLLTPAKLSHALQNASVTLGADVLLNGGIAATDVARKSQANEFTGSQTITATGASLAVRRSGDAPYIEWQTLAGVSMGYIQLYDSTNLMEIFNGQSGGNINLVTSGGGAVQANSANIWTASNDGAGSGLDADLLDGLNASTSATANTIVARDSSGNIAANNMPRTAYAFVGSTGTVTSGSGISASRTGTGVYAISSSGWTTQPILVATPDGSTGVEVRLVAAIGAFSAGTANFTVRAYGHADITAKDSSFMVHLLGT